LDITWKVGDLFAISFSETKGVACPPKVGTINFNV